MKTLLHTFAYGLVLTTLASGHAADVPLSGAPAATFGPARLDVIAAGVGLETQPASLSITIPTDATVVAAYLYVTGRGTGDPGILLNGMAVSLPLVASGGPLPFDATQSIETRRLPLPLGPGTSAFTVDGYDQLHPGGAFVVAVVSTANAPVRTVTLRDGADYAFHEFAPPFGHNTETTAFSFPTIPASRAARLLVFTHDTLAARGDATWVLSASAATVPLPLDLVGGAGGAVRAQRNRLGVPASAGGLGLGGQLDLFDHDVAVPANADYVAFQVESPAADDGDSLGLSAAVLVLPVGAGDGGTSTTTSLPGTSGSSTSTSLPGTSGTSTTTSLPGTSGSSTTTSLPGTSGSSTTTLPGTSATSTTTSLPGTSATSTTTRPPGEPVTSTTLPTGGGGVPPNCGDGTLDLDEECDDGNRVAGDGCDAVCAAEDTAQTWKISLRVKPKDVEKLRYFTTLPALPSALLGTSPVRITLSARGFRMLDAEVPASAFRVRPRPTLVQPDGRVARARGEFGIWTIGLVLKPLTGAPAYDLKLVVGGEMLSDIFGITHLTATFRFGGVVYHATDRIRANRTGKFVRYIHPPLR